MPHKHGVIDELLVGLRVHVILSSEASQLPILCLSLMEMSQAFCHKNEDKMGERVTLSDTPRWLEDTDWSSIQKDAKKRGGD